MIEKYVSCLNKKLHTKIMRMKYGHRLVSETTLVKSVIWMGDPRTLLTVGRL